MTRTKRSAGDVNHWSSSVNQLRQTVQTQHPVHDQSSMDVIFTILMLFCFVDVYSQDPMEGIEATYEKLKISVPSSHGVVDVTVFRKSGRPAGTGAFNS